MGQYRVYGVVEMEVVVKGGWSTSLALSDWSPDEIRRT